MHFYRFLTLSIGVIWLLNVENASADTSLTLSEAVHRVVLHNPSLKAASALQEAARGREVQAAARPNPEISSQFEDFGGNTGTGFGQASHLLSLNQRVELGGKRAARIATASTTTHRAKLDTQIRRQDLILETREAYIALQAAWQRIALANEQLAIAKQVQAVVNARITAGKVSPIEAGRAEVACDAALRRTHQAERDLSIAKAKLASFWGGTPVAQDPAEALSLPSQLDETQADISDNPDLQRVALNLELARAAVQLNQSEQVPDVTLTAGLKHDAALHERSVQFGVSLPLPIFDRLQGEHRAVLAELDAAESDVSTEKIHFISELSTQRQQLSSAYAEAQSLRDKALRTAEHAFIDVQEGYRAGKFNLLEVLETQKDLTDNRTAYLEALVAFHEALARLDRLMGRDIALEEVTQ